MQGLELWNRSLFKALPVHVRHHTDDFIAVRLASWIHAESLADRRGVRQEPLHERLVDDNRLSDRPQRLVGER
jgi:hypothetical protein